MEALTLSQSMYASKLLEQSGMAECKPCVTPMEEQLKLMKASYMAKVDATLYQSIVGGLRYLVHMRPDIAFIMGYVNRFMEDPREDHWATVKWLLCYVKGMVDQGIIFPKTGGSRLQLTMFSDVDMARDIDGRRSTSAVLIFLGSAPISWLSLKHRVVVMSTCEIEYIAVATAVCQAERAAYFSGVPRSDWPKAVDAWPTTQLEEGAVSTSSESKGEGGGCKIMACG
ncbi:secreted RxLR effector protein 161-like [Miscanthus floridulus]|uniref:secreted RxLR effector protein 161-like n=1 Tax=Miscanthus floridulus TaxID=154761 RepID=UPI0034585CF9